MIPDFKDLAQIYQQRALESLSEEDLAHAKRYRIAAELEATCVDHGEIQTSLCERVAELEAVLRECREVLSFINRLDDDRDFLDQPEYEQIHKAIAKIDEVLNEDR